MEADNAKTLFVSSKTLFILAKTQGVPFISKLNWPPPKNTGKSHKYIIYIFPKLERFLI